MAREGAVLAQHFVARRLSASAVVVCLLGGAAQAQHSIAVGGSTALPAQAKAALTTTTTASLRTALNAGIQIDPSLCGDSQTHFRGRCAPTAFAPRDSVGGRAENGLPSVLFSLTGHAVLPVVEGIPGAPV